MIYVFDTNTFSGLFKSFYRSRFPTLWSHFDEMIEQNRITSTREVKRELRRHAYEIIEKWVNENGSIFATPSAKEAEFVRRIYDNEHFQQNIERTKVLKGGYNADSFIIAKAHTIDGTVVTLEKEKPNAVKIPNICNYFKVPWMNLEQFMEAEDWKF